jgi:uncharacterized membrane protein YgdD (TMEM256/DUF423 family)
VNWIRVGAVLAAAAVALGAFGAHAMQERLTPERMETWRTAANYHLVHAVALVALGCLGERLTGPASSGAWALLAGIVVFSGSLYVLCLTDRGWLGAITPLGGIAFLVGWVLIAVGPWSTSST